MQGKVMGGELCETHGTTRNKGNTKHKVCNRSDILKKTLPLKITRV